MSRRPIIIYRYYDEASRYLGTGETPSIEEFARACRAGDACASSTAPTRGNETKLDDFRCYLVAHSMGGLVSRAFLQNPKLDPEGVQPCVDKLFTYATPHNGIDVLGMNVPSWLGLADINNFDRDKRMKNYLDLEAAFKAQTRGPGAREPLSLAPHLHAGGHQPERLRGAPPACRAFVGHGSDGLVKIDNATPSTASRGRWS